jgi:pyruvate/2-oxoglutarate dehydrogenase complex dihydrolipoamide acyltransferase (E2) component
MPRVVAESSSEAVFIASRLQEQDEQLAQHAADADDGPLLANAHRAAAAEGSDAAAAPGSANGGDSGDDSLQEEGGEAGEEEDGDWSGSSSTEAEAPAGEQEAAAAAAVSKKVKFKPLQPLIVLRMTGRGCGGSCYSWASALKLSLPQAAISHQRQLQVRRATF